LLGIILQHPDDIDYMRALFLNAGLEESRRIIDPPLFMAEDEQRLHQVPLEDLALQSDKVLLLDHHTDVSFMQPHICDDSAKIFIWSGRETTNEKFNYKREYCLQYATEVSKHRFPQPQILQFKVHL
jgi:hypothetical protein